MSSFALITEGITDQVSLEAILYEYYDMELDIQYVQPVRDATDESRQATFGGWEKVLEYCTLKDFLDIFLFNEYVVIQIDTDCGEHENFGVSLTHNGADKPDSTIVAEVIALIISKIGQNNYDTYKTRIIFAIAVHSLECWLIPLFGTSKSSRTKNCESHLSKVVAKNNLTYQKDYLSYSVLVKKFSEKNALDNCRKKSASFDIFINSLPSIQSQ